MSVAIIAEYNPFHNGHIYQLKKAKEIFKDEKIYVILTDNYTQRGDFNVLDFEYRKKLALEYGANEVIKLDFNYSTQAAHIFARGAIKLVHDNKIDKIFFGSETEDVFEFIKAASAMKNNLDDYNKNVKKWLKQGFSFVRSSSESLKQLIGQEFKLPNDILGFEYVKEIIFNDYDIKPYCIKRTIPFHSEETNNEFASATYIRELIFNNQDFSKYSPIKLQNIPDRLKNHYKEIQEIIKNISGEELSKIPMVSEGMENLFKKNIYADNWTEFIDLCTSRRYTKSRIQRTLLQIYIKYKNQKK
ncbi:nucleotidyltransferase [Mycoplasma miroungirhinis]|uniref:tRNA(Met) cytidine acetate ligase n=1 Tax=Mycoplasma miroungirhinis TaxID=754516 RepID=A0A6M4JBP2_9MOLU|nr:nucleotidyltransferase [Mycoplasma miroungirhinis]QJR44340.1 nucleotidyltransferase [Mycoplasma miroungirhinis]